MTKRLAWVIGDDLDWHESGGKVHTDADETVVLGIGPDPEHLETWELDLTTAHADELRGVLARYKRAAQKPGSNPLVPASPERPGTRIRREIPGTRIFYAGMREYAARYGFEIPMAGNAPKKNYVYTDDLVDAYIAHLHGLADGGNDSAAAALAMARALGLPKQNGEPEDAAGRAGQGGPDGDHALALTR